MAAVSRDHETSSVTSGDDQASASCSLFSAKYNSVKVVEIILAALSPLYLGRTHFIDFREAGFSGNKTFCIYRTNVEALNLISFAVQNSSFFPSLIVTIAGYLLQKDGLAELS